MNITLIVTDKDSHESLTRTLTRDSEALLTELEELLYEGWGLTPSYRNWQPDFMATGIMPIGFYGLKHFTLRSVPCQTNARNTLCFEF